MERQEKNILMEDGACSSLEMRRVHSPYRTRKMQNMQDEGRSTSSSRNSSTPRGSLSRFLPSDLFDAFAFRRSLVVR
jgi:hypothetical protein